MTIHNAIIYFVEAFMYVSREGEHTNIGAPPLKFENDDVTYRSHLKYHHFELQAPN